MNKKILGKPKYHIMKTDDGYIIHNVYQEQEALACLLGGMGLMLGACAVAAILLWVDFCVKKKD